jgi:large subunit ribosomal protein L10
MRPEKSSIIDDIQKKVNASPFVILTDYTGLKVAEFTELRNRLAAAGSEYRVVKNTLLEKALKNAGLPEFSGQLKGQSAVIVGQQDVCAAAKILKNFTAEFKKPILKGGLLDKAPLTAADVVALSDLPSREVLLAKILGLLQAPASQLARIINTPAAQVAQVLKAKAEKGE